jgi:para-nitrobenzyl esterase
MIRPHSLIVALLTLAGCDGSPDPAGGDFGFLDGADSSPPAAEASDSGSGCGRPACARTDTGWLEGTVSSEAVAFLGVPFAAPPVGARRWRSPSPVEPWQGIRAARAYAAQCPQIAKSGFKPSMAGAEDCLYLNLWAPKNPTGATPVMVFFHGGGNQRGSTGEPISSLLTVSKPARPLYDGALLAARGQVVVVTANYRLGVLGFMTHPELDKERSPAGSGNYGILDQIAALEWIKRNVAAFGGDPERVTILGQSGGGLDIAIHLAGPLSRGLFHAAIVQSAIWNVRPASTFAQKHQKLAQEVGCAGAGSLQCLRQLAPETLVLARAAIPTSQASYPFEPVVDAHVLTESPAAAFAAGRFNHAPVIIGATEEEFAHKSKGELDATKYDKKMKMLVGMNPARLAEAKKLYSPQKHGSHTRAVNRAESDRNMICPAKHHALLIAAQQKEPVYVYVFDQVLSAKERLADGAYHASELLYLFQHMDGSAFSADGADRQTESALRAYWTGLAHKRRPEAPGQAAWPDLDGSDEEYQLLRAVPRVEKQLRKAECELWGK